MKKIALLLFLAAFTGGLNAQTWQQVMENGNSTTKNVYIGTTESVAIGAGAIPQALNLSGKLKLIGTSNAFTLGADGNQPTIYRSGVASGTYPFNAYDHLILQAGYQNRDIIFLTGMTPSIKMVVTGNGSVGIGTTTPKERLSVNGRIRALEVKVETANWPDYVFRKEYLLPSLEDTEKYILENGHLRGIPSAEEVQNDGVKLGEMNAALLKKIEELTLHLIEQNKQLKKQEQMIQDLSSKLPK